MEEHSGQKQDDLVVMCMSMESELHLKQSGQASKEQSPEKYTEELPGELDDANCPKCHSSDIDKQYIDLHDVLHCRCTCGYEWVE